MINISPFLRNHIAQPAGKAQLDSQHEKIYEDLQKRAHEAKPNEAKAKMVEQGPIGSAVAGVIDTGKDCVNFATAIKTGKMSDNNLGRINDLGMKAGALLIASFLASHAKTKTNKIMQFVGGGAFLASMSLWPKMFINLPARLVHGFRIDQKYINAQGDKKDFFLDNQFIPWDAYSKEELEKIGKRTGIDYNSENGEEKIKRKMQKTALQNRTLWMATAGFATPLMTAMFGNFIQPKIYNAVVKNGFDKAKEIVSSPETLNAYLEKAQADKSGLKAVEDLFSTTKGQKLDDNFFKNLAQELDISQIAISLPSGDEMKPLQEMKTSNLIETLKELYKPAISIDEKALADFEYKAFGGSMVKIGEDKAKAIIESLGKNPTVADIQKTLKEAKLGKDAIGEITSNLIKYDNSSFEAMIKNYHQGPLASLKGRVKTYLEYINATLGSTAESMATKEITDTTSNYIKAFNLDYKTLKALKEGDESLLQAKLSDIIRGKIKDIDFNQEAGKQTYREFLQTLFNKEDKAFTEIFDQLSADDKIAQIAKNGNANEEMLRLNRAVLGNDDALSGFKNRLKTFISDKRLDIDAIKMKGLLCANIERRFLQGEFKEYADKYDKQILDVIRKLIYDGNVSSLANDLELPKSIDARNFVENIFAQDKFGNEKEVASGLESFIETFKGLALGVIDKKGADNTKRALVMTNFNGRIKEAITRTFNDKTWMRMFGTMSIALAAVTLLAQPFFGKIKNEYPDKKQGGAN